MSFQLPLKGMILELKRVEDGADAIPSVSYYVAIHLYGCEGVVRIPIQDSQYEAIKGIIDSHRRGVERPVTETSLMLEIK